MPTLEHQHNHPGLISQPGNVAETIGKFSGADYLRQRQWRGLKPARGNAPKKEAPHKG